MIWLFWVGLGRGLIIYFPDSGRRNGHVVNKCATCLLVDLRVDSSVGKNLKIQIFCDGIFLKDRITRGNGTGEQTSTLNNWETWPYHSKQYVRQVFRGMDAYDPRYSGGARASQWQS